MSAQYKHKSEAQHTGGGKWNELQKPEGRTSSSQPVDFQQVRDKLLARRGKYGRNGIYWMLWAAMTVVIVLLCLFNHSISGAIIFGLIGGIYTNYLYNGGRFLILPIGLMFIFLVLAPIGLVVEGVQFITHGSLNEHSSCSDFIQASSSAQANVITSMQAAHHDYSTEVFGLASEKMFCNLYPSRPVDGVYGNH
jgi:hypothetical protein